MNISNSKLESTMVSMAGTLLYLREMRATLLKKPLVPKTVAGLMTATHAELSKLEVQFESTRRAAALDAQPFLTEWLRRTGMQLGGIFRAKTARTFGPGIELTVSGGIEAAHLYCHAVAGIRVVELTLADAEIALLQGVVSTIGDIPVREQASYNLVALRDADVHDQVSGTSKRVLQVRIPIQGTERTGWARCGNLIL